MHRRGFGQRFGQPNAKRIDQSGGREWGAIQRHTSCFAGGKQIGRCSELVGKNERGRTSGNQFTEHCGTTTRRAVEVPLEFGRPDDLNSVGVDQVEVANEI